MWETTETITESVQLDVLAFKMVVGTPLDLENQVNELLAEGFTIHGEAMEYIIPNTSNKVFVQPMVMYEHD